MTYDMCQNNYIKFEKRVSKEFALCQTGYIDLQLISIFVLNLQSSIQKIEILKTFYFHRFISQAINIFPTFQNTKGPQIFLQKFSIESSKKYFFINILPLRFKEKKNWLTFA